MPTTHTKQRTTAIQAFINKWNAPAAGNEKQETQQFWYDLLQQILGVEHPTNWLQFEKKVQGETQNYIDVYIPQTRTLIEQKSADINLDTAIYHGSIRLTPYQQALRYRQNLPVHEQPRWIITSNFKEIRIYDMSQTPKGGVSKIQPTIIQTADLHKEAFRLQFIVDIEGQLLQKEQEISVKAGRLIGAIYDKLLLQYNDPTNPTSLASLNQLCVRIVFCLFAEDAGLFGNKNEFHDYIAAYPATKLRQALINLFQVLDTPINERDPYLDEDLKVFPYVNGGLFKNPTSRDERTASSPSEDMPVETSFMASPVPEDPAASADPASENMQHTPFRGQGGLEIPQLTEEIKTLLLGKASEDFDWSEISPTIFGAVFESTLNQATRREGGMHYTSIENIHKVIDPLFLDQLNQEIKPLLNSTQGRLPNKQEQKQLHDFQDKLASLRFFDPACGSGNFLTETYLSLRRLENKIIRTLYGGQAIIGEAVNPIKVSIHQFYGIEINDFAVSVAKTALWIAEEQMLRETEKIVSFNTNPLPLKTYDNIHEGNALRLDWENIIQPQDNLYIIGNPPFIGHQWRTQEQVEDLQIAFHDLEKHGKLDYVCGWYNKAADFIQNTNIKVALVSTNSICQGESVGILWKHLFSKGIHIDFAHRTFRWDSESNSKAHVHCVIIGFSCREEALPRLLRGNAVETPFMASLPEGPANATCCTIYDNGSIQQVPHINGYLIAAPNVFIESRGKSLTKGMPEMSKGSQPTDGGNLLLSEQEKDELIAKYPNAEKLIKSFVGAEEFINNKKRYCLWLKGVAPSEYRGIAPIMERLERVREMRLKSPTASVKRDADTPMLFTQIRQPETNYLAVPEVSSERRKYVPIGFVTPEIICSNKIYIVPQANLFMFGILTSNVHNAWMRVVAGRLKSDYSYSPAVYNNFPWPLLSNPLSTHRVETSASPRLLRGNAVETSFMASPVLVVPVAPADSYTKIEQTAQAILDARALYPDASLADLYDELTMPVELRRAHQANDRAVMAAYGFKPDTPESDIVAQLMLRYQQLT